MVKNNDITETVTTRKDFQKKVKEIFIPSCIKDFGDTEPFNIGDLLRNATFFCIYDVDHLFTVELI